MPPCSLQSGWKAQVKTHSHQISLLATDDADASHAAMVPTSVRVRRDPAASAKPKGKPISSSQSKSLVLISNNSCLLTTSEAKDEAYEEFMKDMKNLGAVWVLFNWLGCMNRNLLAQVLFLSVARLSAHGFRCLFVKRTNSKLWQECNKMLIVEPFHWPAVRTEFWNKSPFHCETENWKTRITEQ